MRHRAPNKRTAKARGSYRPGGARTLQVYMPEDLFDAVRTYAIEDGRTLAGQFRHMAEFYLKAQEIGIRL